MTKKDQIKEDIVNALTISKRPAKSIFLHLTEEMNHSLSLTSLRRYLQELHKEGLINQRENKDAGKKSAPVWFCVPKTETPKAEEKPIQPENKPQPKKAEEKDTYQKAVVSIAGILKNGTAARVVECRSNREPDVWIISNEYQLGTMMARWSDMKESNYKLITDIKVEPTDIKVEPDNKKEPENNQKTKSETKRYTMDERIQMKKFFANLGADEKRAMELVKDVVAGRATEEAIERTLREEKQAAIGLITPKTQYQRTTAQLKAYDQLIHNFKNILKMDSDVASKIALNVIKSFKITDIPQTITDEIKKEYEEMYQCLLEMDGLNKHAASRIAYDSATGRISDIDAEIKKFIEIPEVKKPVKKSTPKKKKTTPAKKRYTRANALAEAINSGTITDIEGLVEKSNELYVKNGGKDNLRESKWFANYGLGLLESMGILEWKSDGKAFFNHLAS